MILKYKSHSHKCNLFKSSRPRNNSTRFPIDERMIFSSGNTEEVEKVLQNVSNFKRCTRQKRIETEDYGGVSENENSACDRDSVIAKARRDIDVVFGICVSACEVIESSRVTVEGTGSKQTMKGSNVIDTGEATESSRVTVEGTGSKQTMEGSNVIDTGEATESSRSDRGRYWKQANNGRQQCDRYW